LKQLLTVASHAKALTGRISTGPPNWTSLIYNRAEQVIVDVRYWHLADIDGQEEHVRY
jgi:hypothetical protein